MTTNDLNQFRGTIQTKLVILDRSISEMKTELRSSSEMNPNVFHDPLDCAKGEADLSTRVEIQNHATAKRNNFHKALFRLEQGGFGRCLDCNEKIDYRRIVAQPEAALCFFCQEFKEAA